MRRAWSALLLTLLLFVSCRSRPRSSPWQDALRPERTPSPELQLTGTLAGKSSTDASLDLTLRNIGQRALTVDTGYPPYPLAFFAFSLELPSHEWLSLICSACAPASFFGWNHLSSVQLSPSESHTFTLPLTALCGSDPHTGNRIDIHQLHGRMLIELHVPTPPGAYKNWPGYVSASVPLP